jgi:hypothetical protein
MHTMCKKNSEDKQLWTDCTQTVCVKDQGCVKDQSETVKGHLLYPNSTATAIEALKI